MNAADADAQLIERFKRGELPLSALFSQGSAPSLYVVGDAGELVLKPVTVKSYESNSVVITGGVLHLAVPHRGQFGEEGAQRNQARPGHHRGSVRGARRGRRNFP